MISAPTRPLHRACPVCGNAAAQSRWAKGDLRVVQCRHCEMLYANPVSSALASGDHYHREAAAYHLNPDKLAGDFAPARFERELHWFRRFCPAGRVLDAGCSTGAFLHQLVTRFPGDYQVTGMDVAGPAVEHAAQRGLDVFHGSLRKLANAAGRFDAVTFWAVLEHLTEPRAALSQAAALLKPGGHCFVLVPNAASLAARVLGARYRYVMAEHVNYFTARTLQALVRAEPALAVVRLVSMHWNPVALAQDWWRPRDQVPAAERARLLVRTNAWKQSAWLRPIRAAYGIVERGLGALRLADNLLIVLRRVG